MVPDEAEEGTRLACHRSRARRVYGVACGRRSRHEPLRAPGRTRSGDLPLTRRTLCLLSYRGECRKPPAVRRRPPRTRRMGPDREEGHAIVRSGGARRFRGTGLRGPAVRIPPGRVRRFARHGGVEPPSTVLETVGLPPSRWRVHRFRSSVFNHAMPAVSAAAWHGMRSRTAGRRNAFRRPSGFGRLRSAGLPQVSGLLFVGLSYATGRNASSHDAYHSGFYRSCQTNETDLTRIKTPVV